MNNLKNQELRLHISTPTGVAFDDVISYLSIKVDDGYMGINKNRLPALKFIQLGNIVIRGFGADKQNMKYLIGSGLMMYNKTECNIYTEFLIKEDLIANQANDLFKRHELLISKLNVTEKQVYEDHDFHIKQEIQKFQKIK